MFIICLLYQDEQIVALNMDKKHLQHEIEYKDSEHQVRQKISVIYRATRVRGYLIQLSNTIFVHDGI